jgi:hypothetical protein
MDPISLVDWRIEVGQRLIQQLIHDGFDVTVAFWVKASEQDWWHLYIASKVVDERGPVEAYRALQMSLQRLPGTAISLTDVKLIGTTHPLAQQMLGLRERSLDRKSLFYRDLGSSNGSIDEAYIYPTPKPVEVIAKGKEDVLRYLEAESQTRVGSAGEYLLARDETGALVAFIAGHSFVGTGTVRLGGKRLVVVDGIIIEVRDK